MKHYLKCDNSYYDDSNNIFWWLYMVDVDDDGNIVSKQRVLYDPQCRNNYSSINWAKRGIIADIHRQFGKDVIICEDLLYSIDELLEEFTLHKIPEEFDLGDKSDDEINDIIEQIMLENNLMRMSDDEYDEYLRMYYPDFFKRYF